MYFNGIQSIFYKFFHLVSQFQSFQQQCKALALLPFGPLRVASLLLRLYRNHLHKMLRHLKMTQQFFRILEKSSRKG